MGKIESIRKFESKNKIPTCSQFVDLLFEIDFKNICSSFAGFDLEIIVLGLCLCEKFSLIF